MIYIRCLHQSCTTNILPHDASLADPDFQIRGGGGGEGGGGSFGAVIQNLRKEGGGSLKKIFFRPLRPQFCLKIRGGGGGPSGPSPGTTTVFNLYHIAISAVQNSSPCL